MPGGRPRTIFFDIDYFETIDTSDKAYWLGFIFGDGTIANKSPNIRLKIGLAEKDLNHIVKFSKDIKYPNTPSKPEISVNSKKMVFDLMDKGIRPNKTYTGGHPINVPDEFLIDCARGLFDADGSVSIRNPKTHNLVAKLTTNKELLEWFREAAGMGNTIVPVKNHFHYEMRVLASTENFTKLYGNASRYLDRKYELIKPHIMI